jgi:hypothetical protein
MHVTFAFGLIDLPLLVSEALTLFLERSTPGTERFFLAAMRITIAAFLPISWRQIFRELYLRVLFTYIVVVVQHQHVCRYTLTVCNSADL